MNKQASAAKGSATKPASMVKRVRGRRARRGAAMVESLILVPGFAMMLVLNTWVGELYRAKIKTQRESKASAFVAASGNCDAISGMLGSLRKPKIEMAEPLDLAMGMIQSLIMGAPWTDIFTRGYQNAIQVEAGSASMSSSFVGGAFTVNVTSKTKFMCNEKPEKVDFLKVFLYAYAKLTPFF